MAPALVRRVRGSEIELTISEGRKRQVRRMCAAVGHPVLELMRVGFGPLRLGDRQLGRAMNCSVAHRTTRNRCISSLLPGTASPGAMPG